MNFSSSSLDTKSGVFLIHFFIHVVPAPISFQTSDFSAFTTVARLLLPFLIYSHTSEPTWPKSADSEYHVK